jgi:predicted nucleic acid-binding protein
MILCDTNILIEIYRGNTTINSAIDRIKYDNILISDVTCAELLVGARDKRELQLISQRLTLLKILPIQSEISTLSISLLKSYRLSHNLDFHDALIAATALYHNIPLFTLNIRDFIYISGIDLYHP